MFKSVWCRCLPVFCSEAHYKMPSHFLSISSSLTLPLPHTHLFLIPPCSYCSIYTGPFPPAAWHCALTAEPTTDPTLFCKLPATVSHGFTCQPHIPSCSAQVLSEELFYSPSTLYIYVGFGYIPLKPRLVVNHWEAVTTYIITFCHSLTWLNLHVNWGFWKAGVKDTHWPENPDCGQVRERRSAEHVEEANTVRSSESWPDLYSGWRSDRHARWSVLNIFLPSYLKNTDKRVHV